MDYTCGYGCGCGCTLHIVGVAFCMVVNAAGDRRGSACSYCGFHALLAVASTLLTCLASPCSSLACWTLSTQQVMHVRLHKRQERIRFNFIDESCGCKPSHVCMWSACQRVSRTLELSLDTAKAIEFILNSDCHSTSSLVHVLTDIPEKPESSLDPLWIPHVSV